MINNPVADASDEERAAHRRCELGEAYEGVNTSVRPVGSLELLSQQEVNELRGSDRDGLYEIFRRCALAVLNCGIDIDDARVVLERHRNFDIEVIQQERGLKLRLTNAPRGAFVDGKMIKGIQEHLFAVLRDVLYINRELHGDRFDLNESAGVTNAVFHILRNAGILKLRTTPNLVVCWGGHSISRHEYDYTKDVGYEMGLRGLSVITGCGPGAMKGPMKGANIGHAKQRLKSGRYIGISEPGIIAAESPNPIVNHLVILPDIEKRLEAFVRAGHAIVVFPGGVGTAEEILYLLGILLHPENREMPLPLVFTGPASAESYFRRLDDFIGATLGDEARALYEIVIDDPITVARRMREGMVEVQRYRRATSDAYYFNWRLRIEPEFQKPFEPTHANMASLQLSRDRQDYKLAADLRRAFSGIVAGNVKAEGIAAIEEHGPFILDGEKAIMEPLDDLLAAFVAQNRMKLDGGDYEPVYRLG
ncbi:MAG: LOG family protein [Gammaproteobacteria bacterium]|nr:LOG family protein [Gammaproteobacteria bacterium]